MIRYKRVILDEGHNIRNPKTKMTKSIVCLNASRRWVLTGTPIVSVSLRLSLPSNSNIIEGKFSEGMSILHWKLSKWKRKYYQDLGSILTFLKICQPLDNEDFYKRLLLRPLKNGESSGVELLRVSH